MSLNSSYYRALEAIKKSKKAQKRKASGVMATVYVSEDDLNSGKVKKTLRKAFGKLL